LLGNVLENAYRLCIKDIRITAQLSETECELIVEDDGPGVPKHQRERILKRGERLDTQYPGQGIGTAVVKDIIDSYGGQLFVEDSTLGGAQFRIIFPLN
ncbi:MAG TPA: ATP-binding protein, partial [Pseudomonadales bacterium]|nr:ATP-binding protein [Pseudomonadales bacterium]